MKSTKSNQLYIFLFVITGCSIQPITSPSLLYSGLVRLIVDNVKLYNIFLPELPFKMLIFTVTAPIKKFRACGFRYGL